MNIKRHLSKKSVKHEVIRIRIKETMQWPKKGQSTNNDLQNITQKTKDQAKLPNTKISHTVKGQVVSECCRWYFHVDFVFISEICWMLANVATCSRNSR